MHDSIDQINSENNDSNVEENSESDNLRSNLSKIILLY